MTKYEIMVIAAAAAAFVVINIIMWSIIAAKEKKARRRELQQQKNPEITVAPIPEPSPVPVNTYAETEEVPLQPAKERPRVKRSDFILIDDIVIVHTDERI